MNAEKGVSAAAKVPGGVRVLFIGNSITLHGPAPAVGWTNNCGMAASAREKDFVHLVTVGIERETGRAADLRVRNLADFERHFETYDFSRDDDLVAFRPDYLVVALGENVRPLTNDADRVAYRDAFKRLLTRFTYDRMKPNVAVRGAFWPNPERDVLMAHAASDLAMPFVVAPCPDDSHKAIGQFAHGGVASHPGDKGMAAIAAAVLETLFPKRSGFEAWVDGRKTEVRPIRVSRQPFNQWAPGYQRPVDQTEVAGMLRFETDGKAELRVRADRTFKAALVRPLSANVAATVVEGEVRFTLPRPGFYVLELDGLHRPLEIFAQSKRDFAEERREANVVFGPGLHEPVVVKLRSHDRVYIDRDAVVMGSFQADGVEDVKVSGYGIICGSRNRRVGNACYREGMDGAVRIIDSKNVVFDGPTVLDSCCWCVAAFNSSDLELANLKVAGAWRYNTDGIDICNSRRVRVHDCFVHSFDDSLVVKGISHDYVASKKVLTTDFPREEAVEDIAFSNCVCWCGWGRTLEIGLETWAKRMRGIVFEDCDLIHNAGVALSVHLGGPAVVEDATYRNIRIECDGSEEGGVVQTNREQRAVCSPGNLIAWLSVENKKMFGGGGYVATHDFSKEPHGTIRDLTVDNVSIRLTNGATAPLKRIVPQPGTSFGKISISNVALDGASATAVPTHLTCEYRENPVGIDVERPRLSWWIDPAAKEQKAYRIVADGRWDSGWVESNQSVNVPYGGAYPGDLTRVSWRVNVRTDRGESGWSEPASWVTGKRAWSARWIGAASTLEKVPDDRFVVKVTPVPWWELKVNGQNVRYMTGREYNHDGTRPVYVDVTPYLDGSGRDVIDTTLGSTWERVTEMPSLAPPAFAKTFALPKKATRATLAISGLGFYEASLDGRRVGEKRLDPVPTAYDKRVYYSVYELGELAPGEHALEVLLGHGWYDVPLSAVWNWDTAPWRDAPKLLTELRLEYADGTAETIATDASWRRVGSPVLYDNIREGEVIGPCPAVDAAVKVVAAPKGRLTAETTPGTVIARTLKPTRVKDLGNGDWLVDFGENIAGWMRMSLRGLARGDVVSVRYDERVGEGFTPAKDRAITWHFRFVNSSLLPGEGGFQVDRFISSGLAEETYEPRFTYNGFRYVLVKGLKSAPRDGDLTACVLHTDFKTTGTFDCSSRDFLDVLAMVDRAYRGNFANGYPTDCPHREKNGWTGDANLAAELAQYAYENTAAYENWLTEVKDAQQADGQLPGIVPTAGWGYDGYGPVWDMVAAYLPDYLRRYRGDREIADRMRETVERVLDFYLSANAKHKDWRRVVKGVVEVGYADHCSYKTYTRRALPNTCYAIGGCDLIGRKEMAEQYRQAARREFYRGNGLWENGSQTSQACALAFGLCADEETRRQTGEKLIEAVRCADDHPGFGIVGSKHVFRELSKLGRTDLAFKMATQKTLPSFLYWKEKGGTTFMEEFDPDKAPSQNHIMFGDVMAWAYQYLAGIRDVEDGYRTFTLAPDCIEALDHVTAHVETPYGVVESAWRRQDGTLRYEFVVPPGCCARVTFAGTTAEYGPGRHVLVK